MSVSEEAIQFGTDGVRGPWGEALTPEIGYKLGAAAVEVTGAQVIVMVGDTRDFNGELAAAVMQGIMAEGAHPLNIGVAPTPAAAYIASILGAREGRRYGAISLSASHNPHTDAGFKLFDVGGLKLDDSQTRKVEAAANGYHRSFREHMAPVTAPHARDIYTDYLLSTIDEGLRQDGFLSGKKIVVDAANGAAYLTAPDVLFALGASVVELGTDFKQPINQGLGATHPEAMKEKTAASRADYGLALDGDADRLMAAVPSSTGEVRLLDGDDSLHILVNGLNRLGRFHPRNVVVTDYTNFGFRQAMEAQGVKVEVVDNGDRYILERMLPNGYLLGGEQTGHTLLNNVALEKGVVLSGDGTLTAIKQLELAALTDQTIDQMAQWEKYPSELEAVVLPKGVNGKVLMKRADIQAALDQATAVLGTSGRHHVRPSGTEPKVRVLVEHPDQATAQAMNRWLRDVITAAASETK